MVLILFWEHMIEFREINLLILVVFIQDQEENDESNLDDIDENEERCFMYAPLIYHEGLKKMNFRDFFQACRKNQISYDLEKKQGSVFMLSNSLQAGILSLLTIHDSARKAVKATTDALNFLLATAGHTSRLDAYEQQNVDNYYLMDYVYKLLMNNKLNFR
ncbi:hypothetical protein PPERSA_03914 [Pseudocohnilembus persalinus]|uniref:Uncharacterized protein n=1 Tax=Pseudocohnilembus persalinus TaxID=266149 RepID=A0A0V0Q9B8_PSEPJ|nr:hypothetical protein PPERSA_03914 [Pseudocohnilembus persalinus]|eukprot:KRW98779.1 hypothetical protein PPERSA_03914 [Pseudocohnilembus persalinus]